MGSVVLQTKYTGIFNEQASTYEKKKKKILSTKDFLFSLVGKVIDEENNRYLIITLYIYITELKLRIGNLILTAFFV